MIGFPLTRKRFGKNLNYLSYIGMLGDVAVIAGLYTYFKQRRIQKERKKLAGREQELKTMAESFPPKVESIDYNRFSPYTPIPYYVDSTTKFQTHHIDLVNYMNPDKQFHNSNYYFSNYHNSLDDNNASAWENDYHEIDLSRWVRGWKGENHHHGHSHGHHGHGHH